MEKEEKKYGARTKPTAEELAGIPLQVAIGVTSTIMIACIGYVVLPSPQIENPAQRLVFTFRWLVLSASVLLAMVANVASKRGQTAAINPMTGHEHFVEVPNRILRNTVEQFILHTIGLFGVMTYASPSNMVVVPVLVTLFVIGRIVYWIGYLRHPMLRGPGWDITVFPTLASFIYCFYCFVTTGFSHGCL
ncbi:hypothetical protein FSP39_024894 [Pinctada imbricata]|uniref:MAPEG family protein n=1 Tax=Pinctada imbricata TaxID=66713 RepID=A0AA88YWP4_PINIB|nr:hypothetical protein FSP39_024894 [Pinctada imbricata]